MAERSEAPTGQRGRSFSSRERSPRLSAASTDVMTAAEIRSRNFPRILCCHPFYFRELLGKISLNRLQGETEFTLTRVLMRGAGAKNSWSNADTNFCLSREANC